MQSIRKGKKTEKVNVAFKSLCVCVYRQWAVTVPCVALQSDGKQNHRLPDRNLRKPYM